MRHTIPYIAITENIDSIIANLIDEATEAKETAEELDIITNEEVYTIEDILDLLEEIRGVINSSETD